jgi:formylglycine-generating enzyme required for sulfatase activity
MRNISSGLLILCCVFLLSALAASAAEVNENAKRDLDAIMKAMNAKLEDVPLPIDFLRGKYRQELERRLKDRQSAGDLPGARAFNEEIREIDAKPMIFPPKNPTENVGIIDLRRIATEAIEKSEKERWDKIIPIIQNTVKSLRLKVAELTRQGNLDDAQLFQNEIDKLMVQINQGRVQINQGRVQMNERKFEIAPGVAMTFCWIPPGKFIMGSPANEKGRRDNENQVEVTLTKGFWMAKTEVTQAQWEAVMGNNPSNFKGANLPVEKVSWNDVQEFLTKINAMVGNADEMKMVLPTEAQWEYAARAGETGPYSGGTIDEVAWHSGNSSRKTHPVGTKKPNAWGLHDMHGNVWEWCADRFALDLQGGVDPRGANSGTYRVVRGGSCFYGAIGCRSAYRNNSGPGRSFNGVGFRPARSSVP